MKIKFFKKCVLSLSLVLVMSLIFESAFALTLYTVAKNVGNTMGLVAKMISAVALISGLGFIVGAFFKFHQHKQNPTQVTVGQGLVLLVIGAALCIFPTLIPTFESVLTGSTGGTASIWGTGIADVIGAST